MKRNEGYMFCFVGNYFYILFFIIESKKKKNLILFSLPICPNNFETLVKHYVLNNTIGKKKKTDASKVIAHSLTH